MKDIHSIVSEKVICNPLRLKFLPNELGKNIKSNNFLNEFTEQIMLKGKLNSFS